MARFRRRVRRSKPRARRTRRLRRTRRRVRMSPAIRRWMGPELKYFEGESNGTISSTWAYTGLFYPVQGLTGTTRIGNKVLIRKIEFKFNLVINSSATIVLNRFMLFFIRMPNLGDTTPFVADFFPTGTSFYNTAFYSMLTISPYNVIYDKSVTLHVSSDRASKQFVYVTKRPFGVQFGGNTGSIADVVKNAFYLGGWCNQGVNTSTLYYTYRVLYQDV